MKTLILLTFVDFWRNGSGHRSRISALVNFLMDKVQITVFFAGASNNQDAAIILSQFPNVKFAFSSTNSSITFQEYKIEFAQFMKDKYFDVAVVEYIELSGILEYLPPSTVTMLDTHDLVFEKIKSFKKNKLPYDGIILSKKDELQIFECYDYVLLIQKKDFEIIAGKMNKDRLLLVPHPPLLAMQLVRKSCTQIGYVASPYQPNIDALTWFINNVWQGLIKKYDLTLNVYGNIGDCFKGTFQNIKFHGFIENLASVYKGLDIIINPIKCGAGLKIKNVEALGLGIPLITTTHGASGMDDGASKAFLVANKPKQFIEAFDVIINDFDFRTQLGKAGFTYAVMNFSKERSYGYLLKVINMIK